MWIGVGGSLGDLPFRASDRLVVFIAAVCKINDIANGSFA